MSKSMLKIGMNITSNLPMDLVGRMHKLAKEFHDLRDVKTCNGQVKKVPHKWAIGIKMCK